MVFCCGYKRAAGKFSKCYGGYYREYSVNAKAARAIKTVFYALDVVNQGMQEMPSAELEKAVNERGISSRTMRTAKSRIGDRLVTEKDGMAWVCYLRD